MRDVRRSNVGARPSGARTARWTALVLLAALPDAPGAEITRTSALSLLAPDGVPGDAFGTAVVLDGATLVVGAPGADGGKGAVYVFVRDGSSFALQERLTLSAPADGDALGRSLALAGGTLVAGAPGRSGGTGAVAVFTSNGVSWTERTQLVGEGAAPGDALGTSVALAGTTLVAGAPGHDLRKAKDAGAAYVFTGAGAAWQEQARLVADKPQKRAAFGTAVAVEGDAVVVGAPGHDLSRSRPDVGAAYLFLRTGTSWTGGAALDARGKIGLRDALGTSVAIDGDTIAVGAPFAIQFREGMNGSGIVYVFRRTAGGAEQEAELENTMTALDSRGFALALDGDRLFAGAPERSIAPPSGLDGYVHAWARQGSSWNRLAFLEDVPAQPGDARTGLGSSVAVSGNLVAAGGPEMRGRAGVVFLFESPPPAITLAPFATPASVRVLERVRFRAEAQDPDGDRLSFAWSFDEMPFPYRFAVDASLSTTDTTQSFRIPGRHTGRFVAGDGIGVSSAGLAFDVQPATHDLLALAFEERYASRPVRTSDGSEPYEFAKWTLEGALDLTGVDVGAFTAATELHLGIGDFEARHALGDDPNWAPGATSARFEAACTKVPDTGPEIRSVYRTITADWSGGRLRFTVDDVPADGPAGCNEDRWVVGRRHVFVETGPVAGEVGGALVFGPATAAFRLAYAGRTKTTGRETESVYTVKTTMSVVSTGFENL